MPHEATQVAATPVMEHLRWKVHLTAALLLLTACSDGVDSSTKTAGTDAAQQHLPTVQESAETATIGGRMISASIGDASNLIPMIAGDAASHAIADQLYLPLLKYDADLNIVGQLADSWQIAKDSLSITFHLRPHLKWSDGHPFSSADCLFTLQLIQDRHTQSPYKSDYARVISAEAPDALSFVVHYSHPYSPALTSWSQLAILPKHIFANEDIMNTPLSRHPKVTIGPYLLQQWIPQQSITMRRNPDYFNGSVWIGERITRIIPDSATQFLELSAGHIDQMELTPIQYQRLFPNNKKLLAEYRRYRYLSFGYTYLGFNLKRPLFADQRVREAIAYAINRKELVDGVLMGLGKVIATPYKPGTYWVNSRITPRPFNISKARQLLAAAGWHDSNGDGVVERNGRPFTFTILTNNGNRQRADAATIIQQRLKSVGIKIKVQLVEWSAFIENFINKRKFDAVILGWSLSPEPDQYSLWHSSQTGERQFNFLSYHNDRVDRALVAATRTFDRTKRKAYYDQVQQELFNDVPVVYLFAPDSTPAIHRRFRGIKPAPAGIGYNSEQWFVPKELQRAQTVVTP
ncbi:MAG: peptide-binding protein [Mariprofundales bacterium]|nr:peptide-binding protein [Mariprofundales bacterium]